MTRELSDSPYDETCAHQIREIIMSRKFHGSNCRIPGHFAVLPPQQWLRGFVATWLRGYVAMSLSGYVAMRLCGYAATRLRGYVVRVRVRVSYPYAAIPNCSFNCKWLRGYVATRLALTVTLTLSGYAARQLTITITLN